jgi:hypothetical protein
MIGIDATLLMISISGNVYALAIVLSLMGFAMGLIDTTANVSMMTLFGDDVSPFLQVRLSFNFNQSFIFRHYTSFMDLVHLQVQSLSNHLSAILTVHH